METEPLWYELRNAIYSKSFDHAEELFQANPQLLALTDGMGETVLYFLAIENDIEGVAWLHTHGASLNTKNRFGIPMIFEVAGSGHRDLILWLMKNGADFSAVDRKDRGIFEYLRVGHNKLDPDSQAHKRLEQRRRRFEEISRFLAENLPETFQSGN